MKLVPQGFPENAQETSFAQTIEPQVDVDCCEEDSDVEVLGAFSLDVAQALLEAPSSCVQRQFAICIRVRLGFGIYGGLRKVKGAPFGLCESVCGKPKNILKESVGLCGTVQIRPEQKAFVI